MSLEIQCTHCQRRLRVENAAAGQRVKCPQCQYFLTVPSASPSTSKAAGDTRRWYLRTPDGATYGPVPRGELDEWMSEGRVTADCQVLEDGSSQWRWASEMFPQLGAHSIKPTHTTPAPSAYQPTATPHPSSARGHHTGQMRQVSSRSRTVAGLLGILFPIFGFCGIQRFYTGHIGIGLLQLFTFGMCGVWQLIDVVLIFSGSVTDADGLPLND